MPYRVGVKPGKAVSAAGMVGGIVFLLLGVFVAIPIFGLFGVFWTLIAGVITAYHAFNFFSTQGISMYEVDVNAPESVQGLDDDLRRLAKLKADGLLSEEEYERKRAEILRP